MGSYLCFLNVLPGPRLPVDDSDKLGVLAVINYKIFHLMRNSYSSLNNKLSQKTENYLARGFQIVL